MTLEQICVSKEWAEKLKEAGYPQKDSVFYWAIGGDKCENEWSLLYSDDEGWSSTDIIAAPTASEILEKLPSLIVVNTNNAWLSCNKNIFNLFEVGYATNDGFMDGHIEEKSLVDALAKMYCYLVSENIIKAKD